MESKQQIIPVGSPINVVGTLQPDQQIELELVHVFDKMKAVKAFIFDIDGVLTNNELLVTEAGELLRIMNVRDGQAIKWAIEAGYPVAIITGGRSEGAKKRLTDLGVEEYYSGVKDKTVAFQSFLQRTGLKAFEVSYMGDDLPDLPVLRKVALSACPADAVPEVKAACDYLSNLGGGAGCVRDLIEKVMKLQRKWPQY
jgi:3-deoxy-D-manno-octulosonate 8-phosphate phosphatase (KDO 8-P phosphatase)